MRDCIAGRAIVRVEGGGVLWTLAWTLRVDFVYIVQFTNLIVRSLSLLVGVYIMISLQAW